MKRILTSLALSVLMLVSMSAGIRAFADAPIGPLDGVCATADSNNLPSVCKDNAELNNDPSLVNPLTGKGGILLKTARLITYMTGIASVIIVILSGLKYVTSDGDSNSINSAKNTLLYAFVGLIVSLAAQSIILFVIKRLN